MAETSDKLTITAQCLCKAHTFNTDVPTSSLPLEASACHCYSCRHVTGALYSQDIRWPEPRDNVDTSKLKRYSFGKNLTILSCGTCSTPLFWESSSKETRDLGVFTGTLGNYDIDLVKIVDNIFVGDTIDGGASVWLRKPNSDGSKAPCFKERSNTGSVEEYPEDWPGTSTLTGYEKKTGHDSVSIRCHCRGVNFTVHRGNYEDKAKAREELPWFVDPNTYKLFANFDACDSCRLQSGMDIFNWTFSELEYISSSGKQFPKHITELKAAVDAKDPSMGTLNHYQSSKDVLRFFCNVCSATVFYCCDDRPTSVDVAIGLLDSADGARAESFLSWNLGGRTPYVEDTKGGWREGLMERVKNTAEEWRIERDYPKSWRRKE